MIDIDLRQSRCCPLCGGKADSTAFPYETRFNGSMFYYLKCSSCSTVFVDPVPDVNTFSKMYSKNAYHDCHYDGVEHEPYLESARLLRKYLSKDSFVLDYGCGLGVFLKALKTAGFVPYGVDYDVDAADFAGEDVGCKTTSVSGFFALPSKPIFDSIHLGDVLEHLPNPSETIHQLLDYLRPGGVLFLKGPVEINPSPVYYFARLFGYIKRLLKQDNCNNHPPTHMYRTSAKQQLAFIERLDTELECKVWEVYETGWPYSDGSTTKKVIAQMAVALGGRSYFGSIFGNRFKGVFVKS
ncbi:MAG: class I SAM-dependent methyltransferase [Candidatus Scalindua sp.]|nr:class I SAM-dependent methyltransferase [Candidatus Scalindua sp.]